MLRGPRIGLRARSEPDLPQLQEQLHNDLLAGSAADSRAWRPVPPGSAAWPHAGTDPTEDATCFSVVDLADGSLAGEALLWGIDTHHRTARIGVALFPASRHQGLGTEVLKVLCRYGFAVLGLNRLQMKTLSGNTAMITAANRAGFAVEGTLRCSAWVNGRFLDQMILGLLAADWVRAQAAEEEISDPHRDTPMAGCGGPGPADTATDPAVPFHTVWPWLLPPTRAERV